MCSRTPGHLDPIPARSKIPQTNSILWIDPIVNLDFRARANTKPGFQSHRGRVSRNDQSGKLRRKMTMTCPLSRSGPCRYPQIHQSCFQKEGRTSPWTSWAAGYEYTLYRIQKKKCHKTMISGKLLLKTICQSVVWNSVHFHAGMGQLSVSEMGLVWGSSSSLKKQTRNAVQSSIDPDWSNQFWPSFYICPFWERQSPPFQVKIASKNHSASHRTWRLGKHSPGASNPGSFELLKLYFSISQHPEFSQISANPPKIGASIVVRSGTNRISALVFGHIELLQLQSSSAIRDW
jgi:hypothetical protein